MLLLQPAATALVTAVAATAIDVAAAASHTTTPFDAWCPPVTLLLRSLQDKYTACAAAHS